MPRTLLSPAVVLAVYAAASASAQVSEFAFSQQDVLIGVTDKLQASAGYGTGITFGVIDTGAAASWQGFTGRISPLSTGMIANCPGALATTDDNGHGTFTTGEIIGANLGNGLVGIAPHASAIAVKALSANGSGLVADVARGIIYAADRGAQVLNLSLSFVPTPDLVAAINYAALKNAIIVFAGGNSSQTFNGGANVYGLSDAAIRRLVLMGSTNGSKTISPFSNTPGSAGFVSTSGTFYAYSSRWLMADGELIWGASINDYRHYTQMSGTSMAAPQAAGAAGLLAARWPFLINTGTIPAILLASSEDIGAQGVDAVYGDGFLRVDRAFEPIGTLAVPVAGKMVPIGQARILASSVVGQLSKVVGALRDAVAFDSFARSFPLSIGASITMKPPATGSSVATAQVLGQAGAAARRLTNFADGSWLALSFSGSPSASMPPGADRPNPGLIQDPTLPAQNDWSIAFAQQTSYIGMGQGSDAALAFSDARWGGKTAFFNSNADASGALLGLAANASFAAAGMDIGRTSRISMAFATSSDDTLASLAGSGATSHAVALGYTFMPTQGWKISLTSSVLAEQNMMLGSVSGGYLALGPAATTTSLGMGTSVDLGRGYRIGLDMAAARTGPTHNSNSLIGATSRLMSLASALAFSKTGVLDTGDLLGITVKKPLRVQTGSAQVGVPVDTDITGSPIVQTRQVSLVPAGNETDLGVAYMRQVRANVVGSFSLTYRSDADNVAGSKDAAAMVRFNMSF